MTPRQILALVAGAVLVFWILGAYNRLVALRNGIDQIWQRLDEALRKRGLAAEALLAALREPLQAEGGALDTMRSALADAAMAAQAMTTRSIVAVHAAAWTAAEAALAAAASRVFALIESGAADLPQDAEIATHVAEWREAGTLIEFSRQLFNDAGRNYNDAIAMFPTRLLVPMFGFGVAGRL